MKNKKVVKRFGLDFRITVTLFVIQLIMFSVLFLLINNSVTSSQGAVLARSGITCSPPGIPAELQRS